MSGLAYYNENDDFCADWLEGLIEKGLIAPGDVDRRSILDVKPSDLSGYTQCHFFAGIGIWSAALREAGWSDIRPVWTGSCPCQPFSQAGKGGGFDDERHLWPAFHWLIKQCRPEVVVGEQVASPDGLRWLDLVQDDMEGENYAFGALDTSAAGSCMGFAETEEGQGTIEWIRGALLHCPDPFLAAGLRDFAAWAGTRLGYGPAHIRQRLYWVAHSERGAAERHGYSLERAPGGMQSASRQQRVRVDIGNGGAIVGVADADGGNASTERLQRSREQRQQPQDGSDCEWGGADHELADSMPARRTEGRPIAGDRQASGLCAVDGLVHAEREGLEGQSRNGDEGNEPRRVGEEQSRSAAETSIVGSQWIICTDGKARQTQPGIQPLVDDWKGPSRVAVLRASGNALNKAQAVQFIKAMMECV